MTTGPGRGRKRLVQVCALVAVAVAACSSPAPPRRHLVVVIDGLRPDYVTEAVMPNLTALGTRGVVFTRHHSVYPTVTRVNASSIATGAYPDTHGLLGNAVFFPRVDPRAFLDTSDRHALLEIAQTEGRLLTAPTLGESLHAGGRRLLVVSSGSGGSAFLLNHTMSSGAILHLQYALPERLREDMKAVGSPPIEDAPMGARDRYAIDAFLKVGIPQVDPSVTVMWLGELDATAHEKGIGDPATVEVLGHVDGELKRIQDSLSAAGLLHSYNIWVTSDHGFSTHTGAIDVDRVLEPFARTRPDGRPSIIQRGGAIYLENEGEAEVSAIVRALQRTPGVGAIFTRATQSGSFDGHVPGTLSFEAARWTHDRAADVLFSPDWTDAANLHGMRGTTASEGTAGHGSSSPWDIHNTLIAAGPDLKRGVTVDTPSANVDFMPTILRLSGLSIPSSVQGRVLEEALIDGASIRADEVRTLAHTARTADGSYAVTGTFSVVVIDGRQYRYFDGTRVVRK